MRTTHTTEHTPRAMDAMRPWQAFGPPPTPAALDPRRWLGVVLAVLKGATARIARPGVRTWGRYGDTGA
jgi:hypothetical protein